MNQKNTITNLNKKISDYKTMNESLKVTLQLQRFEEGKNSLKRIKPKRIIPIISTV